MKRRALFVSPSTYRLPLDPALARKWDALGEELDVRVLASGDGGDATFRLDPDHGLAAYYARLPYRIRREVRAFDPDVIVAQSPYEALAARPVRGRAKVLLEIHGDWDTASRLYGSRARVLLEPVSRPLARRAVRHADAVRTLSPYTSGLVRAVGVEPAAEFTAYFDESAFTSRPPAPLPEEPSALFVGVLERYKNVAGLAAAWRVVAHALPEARLRIIGAGHETELVRRLVADVPGVEWTERVPQSEVADALDAASLLLLPSFSEGLPRIVMEAFARGRPVVGARAGGIPDIVRDGENGILVDPRDPASIAGGVLRVLRDRALLERLAAAAQADAQRWLETPEGFASKMRRLVEGLA
ncbi:MAG TPA: glycosyltransferase family 4 protein [Gaiellaceae bacterium]|nr:glycosyltransferase family 4 protein [Gaiellaceae bacterium]